MSPVPRLATDFLTALLSERWECEITRPFAGYNDENMRKACIDTIASAISADTSIA